MWCLVIIWGDGIVIGLGKYQMSADFAKLDTISYVRLFWSYFLHFMQKAIFSLEIVRAQIKSWMFVNIEE